MRNKLTNRINLNDIYLICEACETESNDSLKNEIFSLIHDIEDRAGYNSLWIMTHFSPALSDWLYPRRNEMIDFLMKESHIGKQRLLLTLLDRQPVSADDFRTDYLDYCLARINSTLPYGVRSLCIKQAYAYCRFYPELLTELKMELDMMSDGDMSPGLYATRRNILKKIEKIV